MIQKKNPDNAVIFDERTDERRTFSWEGLSHMTDTQIESYYDHVPRHVTQQEVQKRACTVRALRDCR